MKPLLLILLFGLSAFADQASKRKKIEELLSVMNAQALLDDMLEQTRGAMTQGMSQVKDMPPAAQAKVRESQDRTMALMRKALSWDQMRADYIGVYDQTLTEEEIDGMLRFYRTPAGQSVIKKMPVVMRKSVELGQRRVQEIMPEIQAETQRLMKDLQAIRNSAPPPAKKPAPAK